MMQDLTRSAYAVQGFLDGANSRLGILVLPDSHDDPSLFPESQLRVHVSTTVCLDLLPPPVGVSLRPGAMLRATVPEAPVYEYRYPLTREGDVGPSTKSR